MAHILVVDDDQMVLETVKIMLENLGHSYETAHDGDAGLKLLNQTSFDLIITDIIMPDKDGIELVMAVKKMNPSLKIIAISGGGRQSSSNYLKMAKSFGADGLIAKPFSLSELEMAINNILA